MHHNSPFTVAGMPMSSSSSTHHLNQHITPTLNTWGSSTSAPSTHGTTLGDSLSQSMNRSHYQSGYLMSSHPQNTNQQQSSRTRADETPVVQTKAKMNHVLARSGSASNFGMDSMFESSRGQRQHIADEDAPPTTSVNDIPDDLTGAQIGRNNYSSTDSIFLSRMKPKHSHSSPSTLPTSTSISSQGSTAVLHVIIFGYPLDKYASTVEYFKSLCSSACREDDNEGDSGCTEPDPNIDVVNCFRIGYRDAADALRAVRKNGEVIGGQWMVGVKWADPAQAESLLGSSLINRPTTMPTPSTSGPGPMAFDSPSTPQQSRQSTPGPSHSLSLVTTVGTPIRLAPSSSAFRTPGQSTGSSVTRNAPGGLGTHLSQQQLQQSPSKGVLGQVSDLIFGW